MAATAEGGGVRGAEAVVCLFTRLPEQYQIPEDQLVVPSSLARYGLSEVVNRLLSFEAPVPFDFLTPGGEYLRTSLLDYLEARKLSSEKALRLEYVLALNEPEQTQVEEVPDWISSVVPLQASPSGWFAAASCDGTLRVYEGTNSRVVARLCDGPLAGMAALPVDGGAHVVVAAKDGTTRCCRVKFGRDGAEVGPVAALRGPSGHRAMEATAISEDGTLMASAGWDQEVLVWNAADAFAPPSSPRLGAKRKAAGTVGDQAVPKFSLRGHSQVVSSLHFGAHVQMPFTLLSASWDCSVRVWDIAAASCVCNWGVARAVTSFSVCAAMPPQLATSHEDGHVSLWDVRASPHSTVQGAVALDMSAGLPLTSSQLAHKRLAAQVAWCPEDVHRIASVGHDGYLCVLDPRSPKMPLQRVRIGKPGSNPTKLLCCAWLGRDALAVGGSDGRVVRVAVGDNRPMN